MGLVSVEESSKTQLHKGSLEPVNIKENWIIKLWIIQGTEEVVIAKTTISQPYEKEEITYSGLSPFFLKN